MHQTYNTEQTKNTQQKGVNYMNERIHEYYAPVIIQLSREVKNFGSNRDDWGTHRHLDERCYGL